MHKQLVPLLLAVHAFVAGLQCQASEPPPGDPLRLELSLVAPEILQHEPIVLSVRLTNVSTENVELDLRLEQEYSTLQFNVSDPYGRSFPHRWIANADSPAGWRQLGPGESIVHRQWLFFGMRRHEYFEFPGEYRIDASFGTAVRDGPALTLRSEPVAFQVQWTPPTEVEAWDVFHGTAREAMGILKPADWTQVSRRLGAIPYNCPHSRYASWSLFFLGRGWQLRQWKDQDQARREAAAAFERLVADHPDFPLGIEARYFRGSATAGVVSSQELTGDLGHAWSDGPRGIHGPGVSVGISLPPACGGRPS